MKIYIYVAGEDFFNHELSHCHVDKAVGNNLQEVGWLGHIAVWEKRFNQKMYSRLSLYEIDVVAGTCVTLLDHRHPIKEKIVVNKAAIEARKSPLKKHQTASQILASMQTNFQSGFGSVAPSTMIVDEWPSTVTAEGQS